LVFLAVVPALTGIALFKLYRLLKPMEKPDTDNFILVASEPTDGFLKKFFVGWLIWAPLLFILYLNYPVE